MEPITLRLPDDLLTTLETEATNHGFSSRSEYIRFLLTHRDDPAPAAIANATPDDQDITIADRMTELETQLATLTERVDHLEAATLGENTPSAASSDQPAWTDALADWLARNHSLNEHTVATLIDAAQILDNDGPLRAKELGKRLYERHTDEYGSQRALMSATVNRYYDSVPGFAKPERGHYTFDSSEL